MVGHVVVISDLSVERDGPTTIAAASARYLRQQGVKVSFVCGDDGDNPELRGLGVDIIAVRGKEIGYTDAATAATTGLYNRAAAHTLKRLIDELDDENTVYHLHNWSKILSPSIFLPLRRILPRLVISTHDYFTACPNGGYFDFKREDACTLTPLSAACLTTNCDRRSYPQKIWRVLRDLERRAFMSLARTSATVLAVHDGMVPHLVRGGVAADAIEVLRNPVQPWSEARIAAEKNRKFLFVGRLEHDKGADLLARAARIADVPLLLVGEGVLRPMLAEQYPEVELAGWRPREEVALLAREARALVMPTGSRETFGLVAFEALTSGVPAVVSKFAATCDEMVGHRIGFSCDPHDANALAAILKTLSTDDAMVREMSERAFASRDELTLSRQGWGDRLIAVYESKLRPARANSRNGAP